VNLQKVAALACVMTALFATPSTAEPTQSDWFSIASLAGGWVEGHLRVVSSGPFHNPSSCPYADGYVVDDSLPGAQLLQAMLITAYASGDQVQVTVDGCASGRPSEIGVQVRKST
jgi:hypothetical protein